MADAMTEEHFAHARSVLLCVDVGCKARSVAYRLLAEIDRLRGKNAKLREVAKTYGNHVSGCRLLDPFQGDEDCLQCNCGWVVGREFAYEVSTT